jgi:hypothetical protein
LQKKLLAAVPVRVTRPAAGRHTGRLLVPLGAAAAVVLAVIVAWPRGRSDNAKLDTEVATIQTDIPHSPRFHKHDPKETDPCNILPPLADWR